MLVIQLIYQQVEYYAVYPIVYRKAVELSAFTTIVAVLIAGSLLGVVGAILAVPFAAVIKIVLREAGAPPPRPDGGAARQLAADRVSPRFVFVRAGEPLRSASHDACARATAGQRAPLGAEHATPWSQPGSSPRRRS